MGSALDMVPYANGVHVAILYVLRPEGGHPQKKDPQFMERAV